MIALESTNDKNSGGAIEASVIVPVYKAEKYLRKCVDSILGQTWKDFELVLIDDGSPDQSGKICDEYAAKDRRVRVYHQPNQGVTRTREIGVEKAQGKYIFWVDADDYAGPELLEKVMRCFQDTGADIVVYGHQDIENGKFTDTLTWEDQSLEKWRRDTLTARESIIWNCAVPREFWLGESAPSEMARSAADGYMAIQLFMKASKVAALPDILYYHLIDNADSIRHNFSGKRYLGNAYLWHYRMKMCERHFPEEVSFCAERALSGAVKAFCMSLLYQDLSEKEQKELLQVLQELRGYAIPGRSRDKILSWAIRSGHWWLCRVYANHKHKKEQKENTRIRQEQKL